MTTELMNDTYLDADDLEMIETVRRTNLSPTEMQAVIDEIQREAFQRNRNSLLDKPPQQIDVTKLPPTPKQKPPGYDESMARVKQGLEKSKLEAPTYGTATQTRPFYAAEKKDEAERQRVAEWAERKKIEIQLREEASIQRQIDAYTNAKSPSAKAEAIERMSRDALARLKNLVGSKSGA